MKKSLLLLISLLMLSLNAKASLTIPPYTPPSAASVEPVTYNQWVKPGVQVIFGTNPEMSIETNIASGSLPQIGLAPTSNLLMITPIAGMGQEIPLLPQDNPSLLLCSQDFNDCIIMFTDGNVGHLGDFNKGGMYFDNGFLTGSNDGPGEPAIVYTQTVTLNLTPTDIVQMNGFARVLVNAPPPNSVIRLVSAVLAYNYSTAAYTGGGNILIGLGNGSVSVVQASITKANSVGASSNQIATNMSDGEIGNGGLNLTAGEGQSLYISNDTGAFVNPGTAAGTLQVTVTYQVISGLPF